MYLGSEDEAEDRVVNASTQVFSDREIMDIKAAASYLGVSRSHLSHILAGKVSGVPGIPHVRAGRRALIRRVVIDRWLLEQEHGVARSVSHDTIESPRIHACASQGESMRRRRFQKGSLQLRKHADRRVWVVLYYDQKSERRYHTLGWASEMNKGQADEKRQDMREINGGARTTGAIRPPTVAEFLDQCICRSTWEMEGIDGRYVREPTPTSY